MKKFIVFMTVVFLMYACASDNDLKTNETKAIEEKTEDATGIQNADSNIPDTTNSMQIGTYKKDTTMDTGRDGMK